jgi:hypothetical protein
MFQCIFVFFNGLQVFKKLATSPNSEAQDLDLICLVHCNSEALYFTTILIAFHV